MWSKKSGYGLRQARLAGRRPASSGWTRASAAWRRRATPTSTATPCRTTTTRRTSSSAARTSRRAKQITTTNAFQANYAWGQSEIVDYKTDKGVRLQGALYYPAGYEPGKRYPMIVYIYEKLSDSVHRYVAPSDRDYYNTTVFTSQGYFVFQPDIVFRPRQPGLSVVECVTPGVKKVDVDGRGRSEARRRHRPLVGRIRHGVSRDAHERRVRGGGRRRADHRSREQLRQPSLELGHRGDRSHRDRPAAHGSAALRGSAGLHRELRGVQRAEHDGAAAHRSAATPTARCSGTRASSSTTSRGARRRTS